MNHEDVKKALFEKNPQLKKEYDDLEQIYKLKSLIIQLRIEKGWSQKELAEHIGTRQSAISRLESSSTAFLETSYTSTFSFSKLRQRYTTGCSLNSEMPFRMRSINSAFELTRM